MNIDIRLFCRERGPTARMRLPTCFLYSGCPPLQVRFCAVRNPFLTGIRRRRTDDAGCGTSRCHAGLDPASRLFVRRGMINQIHKSSLFRRGVLRIRMDLKKRPFDSGGRITSHTPCPAQGFQDIWDSLRGSAPNRCHRERCCRRSARTGTSGIHRHPGIRRASRYVRNEGTKGNRNVCPHGRSGRDDIRSWLRKSASSSDTSHGDHAWSHGLLLGFSSLLPG